MKGREGKGCQGGAWGRGQRAPEGSQGKVGDPSTGKGEPGQESAEVLVGKGWVSTPVLTRSWALRSISCRMEILGIVPWS